MSLVIFSGPSLAPEQIRSRFEAHCLPPIRYGDLHRAVTTLKPRRVAIIDGYFNQVPAVWHKEILWALDQGVAVFGAASMGALRAAELADFGMTGVGLIAQAYATGRYYPYEDAFENDDEVAIVHGPAELNYTPASEALVNIRATLLAAADAGVIDPNLRDQLVAIARARFYPERTLENLLADGARDGLPAERLEQLRNWWPENFIDQKRRDAEALLQRLEMTDAKETPEPEFRFEHTSLWEQATWEMLRPSTLHSPVLDELRLLGHDYLALRESLLGEAFDVTDNPVQENSGHWADAHLRIQELDTWRDGVPEHWLAQRMMERLADTNNLARLQQRAEDKAKRLPRPLPASADLEALGQLQLMDWYFSEQLGMEIPDSIAAYANLLGGLDEARFTTLVLQEYCYLHPEANRELTGE